MLYVVYLANDFNGFSSLTLSNRYILKIGIVTTENVKFKRGLSVVLQLCLDAVANAHSLEGAQEYKNHSISQIPKRHWLGTIG